MSFARALRAILRQDPDVVMIGEIRDLETAQIAVQASLTGHLVFATLHTNDAVSAVTRLIDMGVEPFLLASEPDRRRRAAPRAQAVPRVPQASRRAAAAAQLRSLGLTPAGGAFYAPQGCAACNRTGYRGRTGIYELLHGRRRAAPADPRSRVRAGAARARRRARHAHAARRRHALGRARACRAWRKWCASPAE